MTGPERPTLLAALVANDERTQEEILSGYLRCARENNENATLSLRTLRRWMSGQVTTMPRAAQCRVARHFWGHNIGDLLSPVTPATEPDSPAGTQIHAMSHRHIRDSVATMHSDPDLSDWERTVHMSSRRAARFAAFAENHNVGDEAVDQLRADISQLANAYLREPMGSVVGDLVEVQDTVFGLLEGKQRPALTRDLYVLAGLVSGLMAKISQDLGRMHDAMTQARTVYICADNADHTALRAWARGLQSLIAYWSARPQEATRYAAAGTEIAHNLTGTVTAWLPALHARALAQLGDAHETHRVLNRALEQRHTVVPDDLDQIGGLLTFPVAKQHYYAAGAYVFLQESGTDAAREAQHALDLYHRGTPDDRSYSDEAGARTELALARIHSGHLDGAREPLADVFDLPPQRRIGGIIASTNRVHHALRDRRYADSATAREIRDEIEAFCQLPAAALPAS